MSAVRDFRDALLLNVSIITLCLVFKLAKILDARFRKAINSFAAAYQFRAGKSARQLIFNENGIKSLRGKRAAPDFEIRFIDLPGALSYMAKFPNDPVTLVMENKIEQIGNLYFLYKFGYLCGLCETFFSNISFRNKHSCEQVR